MFCPYHTCVCDSQETKQQLAASESAKDSLQETVSGQAAEISQLTKDLASVTSDQETAEAMLSQIRAEATQKGNDLSKVKSGTWMCQLTQTCSLSPGCAVFVLCHYMQVWVQTCERGVNLVCYATCSCSAKKCVCSGICRY